ncbi:MAG: YhbY family RNA-binding protein [Candidatus Diapherotrites archaeon]|nr:YhbY family RNA-binding protein [Candidatus Diapherotrites archaeon]
MEAKSKKPMKSKAMHLEPALFVGKSGVTDNFVSEVKTQFEKNKLIKIKIQKSIKDKKEEIIDEVLKGTNSELIETKGNTFVIFKK